MENQIPDTCTARLAAVVVPAFLLLVMIFTFGLSLLVSSWFLAGKHLQT